MDTVSGGVKAVLLCKEERVAAFAGVNQLVREEKLDRALEEAGKLVEMYPDRSKIQADLGGILYKMGQYDSAELHASIAVELDSSSVALRHFRAMCCEKRQDFLAARTDCKAMACLSGNLQQKLAALKLSEEVMSQFKAACTASDDDCATQKNKKKRRNAAESAKAKIAELEAITKRGLEIRKEAAEFASSAKSRAHNHEAANRQIQQCNHEQAIRRADQQNKPAEAEGKCASTPDLFTEHAHELNLTVDGDGDGDDSQPPYVKERYQWLKHNCEAAPAGAAASPSCDTMLSPPDAHLLAQSQSCSNSAAQECKLSTLPNLSAPPMSHSDKTSPSVTPRLPSGDGHTELKGQKASCRQSPQSSLESVHEPTLTTPGQRPIPLSWAQSCQTPGDLTQNQMCQAYHFKKAGDAAYRKRQYLWALAMYNNSIAIIPTNAIMLSNRAAVCLKLGLWSRAVCDSEAALQVVPRPHGLDVSKAHCHMARGWLGKGDPHRGMAVVQTRLQKDPMHPGLQALQAELLGLLSVHSQGCQEVHPNGQIEQDTAPAPDGIPPDKHVSANRSGAEAKKPEQGAAGHALAKAAAAPPAAARVMPISTVKAASTSKAHTNTAFASMRRGFLKPRLLKGAASEFNS